MKSVLQILTAIALLPITGCIFPGNRDYEDNRNRSKDEGDDEHPSEVDHKDYPVDAVHGESLQT
jgi:hypothetical protein